MEEEQIDETNIQALFDAAITAGISALRGFIALLERVAPYHPLLEEARRELQKQIRIFTPGGY